MHTHKSQGTSDTYMSVILHNYHDGEYPFDRMTCLETGVHVRHVWDYTLQELAEMSYPSKGWGSTGDAQASGVSDEAIALFKKFLETQLGGLPIRPNDDHDLFGQTIFIVSGTVERVYAAFKAYCHALENDVVAHGPGADDGTYDYFPGAVEVCLQLVAAFEEVDYRPLAARGRYNQLVTIARETHYKDNEEVDDLLPYVGAH